MPKKVTDSDLSLLGRLGAHSMHAKYDSRETSRAGREAFLRSFEEQVDPAVVDPAERARRAEHAKKAYFAKLALLSAQKRRKQ